MTATKTRRKPALWQPPASMNGKTDNDYCVVIPPSATTLAGFRTWSCSDAFPERGKITFLGGEIIVDMSPERINSHVRLKVEVCRVLANLMDAADRGPFYIDGARF